MIKRIIYSLLPIIGGAIVGLITSGYMNFHVHTKENGRRFHKCFSMKKT